MASSLRHTSVIRLSPHSSEDDLHRLRQLAKTCDDTGFSKDAPGSLYLGMYSSSDPSDVYLGLDSDGTVCAVAHTFTREVSGIRILEVDNVTSKGYSDRSYKGTMLKVFSAMRDQARDVSFMLIRSSTLSGLKFYIRFGFLAVGRTNILVKKITDLPSLFTIRELQLLEKQRWTEVLGRPETFSISEAGDNISHRRRMYCSVNTPMFSRLQMVYKITSSMYLQRFAKKHSLVYTDEDLRDIQKFPSWTYKAK